jgi:hypothetical protein
MAVKATRAGEGISASNPPGHRWRRATAALDHATGQAVATSSRTRSTPQRRLIRGRDLALARTQPLALAIGHRTHAKGRQATAKGSAAPPISGQRGHFSRPFPGPCVRVRWRAIEYRTRANNKGSGAPCGRVDSRTITTARKRQNHGRAVAHWNKPPKPGTSASNSSGQGKRRRWAKKKGVNVCE